MEERCIAINISTHNTEVCIAKTYSPNFDDPSFFQFLYYPLRHSTYSERGQAWYLIHNLTDSLEQVATATDIGLFDASSSSLDHILTSISIMEDIFDTEIHPQQPCTHHSDNH